MTSESYCSWSKSAEEVISYLQSDERNGLDPSEVLRRRDLFGWNELEKEEKKPLWKLILEQFEDALVRVRENRTRIRQEDLFLRHSRMRMGKDATESGEVYAVGYFHAADCVVLD